MWCKFSLGYFYRCKEQNDFIQMLLTPKGMRERRQVNRKLIGEVKKYMKSVILGVSYSTLYSNTFLQNHGVWGRHGRKLLIFNVDVEGLVFLFILNLTDIMHCSDIKTTHGWFAFQVLPVQPTINVFGLLWLWVCSYAVFICSYFI